MRITAIETAIPSGVMPNLLLVRALDRVHGDRGRLTVLQPDRSIFEALQFVCRKKPDTINQRKTRHQINISSSCAIRVIGVRRPDM